MTDETVYDFQPASQEVSFNAELTGATVELKFNAQVETNADVINNVALYDENDNVVDAKIENFYDMEDLNMWSFNIEYAFEADKEYKLVVPKGSFGDLEWASDSSYAQYNSGHANAEFTVILNTSGNVGVDAIGAEAGEKAVYNLQGIKLGTVEDLKTLPAGLYIIDGVKTVVK